MNIVTPILTAIAYPTANVNTESARRDNALRETIPQSGDAEKGESQKGLGSESDKSRNTGQAPAPVTYERPQIQTELQSAFENVFGEQKDNGSDESAGKQDAHDQQGSSQQESGQQASQPEQQSEDEQQEISDLETRDQEVRTHEQAHAAAGGQYAGSPQYEYTTGPDNKRYVTDGEVSIDISELNSPEETLRKMEQVRAAALAPAEPSAQDLKVAAEATQKSVEARSEIAEDNAESSSSPTAANYVQASESSEANESNNIGEAKDTIDAAQITPPDIDEITDNAGVERPTRSLDEAELQAQSSEQDAASQANSARIGRIQSFYAQTYTPLNEGFSASA
ncbi:putative metalloprotease CJM1_0395 family protein [Alteromonas sp. 1_MG-2023]|uniref:putative metalloprotease CJM1_0395 family protein n=1 Tax=Alteromonas sp. 1_MG-2023 TaxID=3062669 RepID=UPI0026E22958|nr:putative metalloprotease CJM1_0395 family protein [Alteromonas sp. 1_MG-2023]MDO6566852.1 putative metalloprotease CJM1_0395 family protein [Alteromonas sp. 1_MG-2023]